MAKRKSKAVVEEVEVEEDVDEIEDIEDLEELADAEAPEDDTDDEEEDEDAPKRTKSKTKKRKAPEREGIGTRELAEALNTDGRNLRVMLRKKGANETRKFKKEGRYHWDSIEEALEELGFDDVDDAQEALTEARDERLEELKARPKKSKTKAKAKATSKTKKRKVVDEDDEDEDEEE
jgi:hypothetical protein